MSREAKAVVFSSPSRKMELRSFPVGTPAVNEVLLKLHRSGICGTDVHICEGRLPLPNGEVIIGHEFIGHIDTLGGNVKTDALGVPVKKGDLAIVCVAIPCGKCVNCLKGETSSCMSFGVTYMKSPAEAPHFHGGYGEYVFAPSANIVKIPSNVSADAASAFPCVGPTMIRAFKYGGGAVKGELVAVQGTGAMGLFAIAWAKAHGCRVVAIGSMKNQKRNELAKRLGAEKIIDFRSGTTTDRAKAIGGNGADMVIETSGAPSSFAEGLELLRIRGRYLVPGQYSNSGGVEIQPQLITFKALQVIGSGQYNLSDVAEYLEFIGKNPELAAIFAECSAFKFRVEDFESAFAAVKAGECIKAVFVS